MIGSLQGKTILLTGATSGIGLALARSLASSGSRLLIHGRNREKLSKVSGELSASGAAVQSFVADLSSLKETAGLAREAAEACATLDILINNAGVGFGRDGNKREVGKDGFELRFAVNYLAPFLLTEELIARGLPRLAVINVASAGQDSLDFEDLMTESGYGGVQAYCRSKLALIMMSFDLAALHPELQVQALHPGTYLDTGMVREAGITPHGPVSRGVESILSVLAAALGGGTSGQYFDQSRPARALAQAYNSAARQELREASLRLVAPWRSA
ncbi:MAG TPA: SDR family NAD(P)-dependent oxidoreductase [Spirochaetia bacterium]|nr:SDR family NAD(P)-dependent oxidoreductase [Spirochaetia bacterium]